MNARNERGHIEIVEDRSNEQPFHVRIIGGNNELVLHGEQVSSERDAEKVALMLARMVGAPEPQVLRTGGRPSWGVLLGTRRAVDILYIDETPEQP